MDAPAILLVAGWLAIANGASFALYGVDKHVAAGTPGRRRARIPETTLLTVDFAGGFPTGYFAQRHFRHKTRKRSFQARWWLVAFASAAAWTVIALQSF